MFNPQFKITPRITQALMNIEKCREAIDGLPITTETLISLRESAKLAATHYSTYIEGNRLTQEEVGIVVIGQGTFPGRKREEAEVRNYYTALTEVETISRTASLFSETHIKTLHSIVENGKRKISLYRDGQNVIRDSGTGGIVYMPPEAPDVPKLMQEFAQWINNAITEGEIPIPIIAAIAHYQFVTIHPYYDGNGRTARLLTTLILHMKGYGLKGIYALEEYYAVNLPAYYNSLTVGESHNYYMGRADCDITEFVHYFCIGMEEAFLKVKQKAELARQDKKIDQSPLLRKLEPKQRQALCLFKGQYAITANEVAKLFNLKPRSAQYLCTQWVEVRFLKIINPSKKKRLYALQEEFEQLISG
jgi:Fic family protein